MNDQLTKEQIEDLIEYCGSTPTRWKNDEMMICCNIHGESNPSMGVSADKQIVHCFSCGFSGRFDWYLFKSKSEEFKSLRSARKFLKDRYELEYRELSDAHRNVSRYEDIITIEEEERHIIPMYKIAPFMSGKETYKYFYDRGFDKEDLIKFKIGRDLDSKTVTIPAFWEDNTLAGIIGRYISPNRKKNERYKIYDFPRGELLYPLNLFEPINDTIIIVEGMFDAMKMHKLGYTNTLAKMGVELTKQQADIICSKCSIVIDLGDNDERGQNGIKHDRELLKDFVTFKVVDYPNKGKDPCNWNKEEIDIMIKNAHSLFRKKVRRL